MRWDEVEGEVEVRLHVPTDCSTYLVYSVQNIYQKKIQEKKKPKRKTGKEIYTLAEIFSASDFNPIQFNPVHACLTPAHAHSYSHTRTSNRPAAGNGDVYCSVWNNTWSRRSASQQARWISWLMTKYCAKRESTRR